MEEIFPSQQKTDYSLCAFSLKMLAVVSKQLIFFRSKAHKSVVKVAEFSKTFKIFRQNLFVENISACDPADLKKGSPEQICS